MLVTCMLCACNMHVTCLLNVQKTLMLHETCMLHECRKRLQHTFNMHVALRMLLSVRCMFHACYMRTFSHRVTSIIIIFLKFYHTLNYFFCHKQSKTGCGLNAPLSRSLLPTPMPKSGQRDTSIKNITFV